MEQLTQLLLDENKSEEAIKLLDDMTAHSPSPTLYDLLGDAYTQTHDYAQGGSRLPQGRGSRSRRN